MEHSEHPNAAGVVHAFDPTGGVSSSAPPTEPAELTAIEPGAEIGDVGPVGIPSPLAGAAVVGMLVRLPDGSEHIVRLSSE
jgi:hypothetical protein